MNFLFFNLDYDEYERVDEETEAENTEDEEDNQIDNNHDILNEKTENHEYDNENEISNEIAVTTTANSMPVEPTVDPYTPRVLDRNCGDDNGGCEHICERLLFPGENEPRLKCSCSEGFSLDPYDYSSCHGNYCIRWQFLDFYLFL